MKALVLAGGSGTRLRPFSYSMAKQLIPIAGRPVLEHVLENIRDLGVTETGIIVGDWGEEISSVVGDGSRFGMRVTYIPQEEPLGLAHCVLLARPFLGDDDFVMYLGDNMLPEGVIEIGEDFRARRPAAQVVVRKVGDPREFGVAELGPDGQVERLVEKPDHPRSDLAVLGVYFFTSAVHEAVEAIEPGRRGELEITDAIQWLADRRQTVLASEYTGYWKDTGRIDDVLECNRRLLEELDPAVLGEVDGASTIEGRVVIEEGARVARSHLKGPAVVGAGSVVEDCQVGPHTSIGKDCALRASDLADSMILEGASITGIPSLRGSVIGRSAVVDATQTHHHRLVVGDHTKIEMTT